MAIKKNKDNKDIKETEKTKEEDEFSFDSEKEDIKKRLREMGYID